jgi:hypothetical protein
LPVPTLKLTDEAIDATALPDTTKIMPVTIGPKARGRYVARARSDDRSIMEHRNPEKERTLTKS